jgi:hypothetical protein
MKTLFEQLLEQQIESDKFYKQRYYDETFIIEKGLNQHTEFELNKDLEGGKELVTNFDFKISQGKERIIEHTLNVIIQKLRQYPKATLTSDIEFTLTPVSGKEFEVHSSSFWVVEK